MSFFCQKDLFNQVHKDLSMKKCKSNILSINFVNKAIKNWYKSENYPVTKYNQKRSIIFGYNIIVSFYDLLEYFVWLYNMHKICHTWLQAITIFWKDSSIS